MSEYLTPTWVVGSVDLTDHPFSVDRDGSVDIGEPEMVVEGIPSLVADGDEERVVRHGNRVYVLKIYIEGPTLLDVAEAEATLRAELRRSSGLTLTHNPGGDFSPASVYEVKTARLTPERRDEHESHLIRQFTLTLTCAPFARSVNSVTVGAIAPPPVSPTTVTVNGADTTAGWYAEATTYVPGEFGYVDSTPPVVDLGLDGISTSANCFSLILNLVPASPVALTGTPYLLIEMSGSTPTEFAVYYDGSFAYPLPLTARALPGGHVQYALAIDSSRSLTALSIRHRQDSGSPSSNTFNVFDVSRTNTLPASTTHQSARVIEGRGTERAPASIHVRPGTSGASLGWTVVHTTPETSSGYSPALRQFRALGNTVTVDSTLMSGGREAVNATPVVAQVPLTSLPEGEYALVALMRSTVVGTFNLSWQARTFLPGIGYLGGTGDVASAKFTTANTWTLIPLAVVTLPPVRATQQASVQLDLNRSVVASEVIELDEWWSLRMGDDCATTILNDNASFLWLDSPDVSSGAPRIWVGGDADRSDAHHPSTNLYAQGAHTLHPDGTGIFVATSGLAYPNVSATYYPRWHSNAAE